MPELATFPESALPATAGPETVPSQGDEGRRWAVALRLLGERTLLVYFALVLFPFPFGFTQSTSGAASAWLVRLEDAVGRWTATRVLGLHLAPWLPHGFDTLLAVGEQVDCLVLALAVASVWTLLRRRTAGEERTGEWLRAYVRFGLAGTMLGFGMVKLLAVQMREPSLSTLATRFGAFTPEQVLWNFMGTSPIYEVFTGAVEALGAVLLLFRRTTTAGALLLAAALTNVVLLNFTYDVAQKFNSSDLLLMACFFVAADARRLLDMFVFNRPVAPQPTRSLLPQRARYLGVAAALAVIGLVGVSGATYVRWYRVPRSDRPPLYGIYDVEEFQRNGVAQVADSTRWRYLIFNNWTMRDTLSYASALTASDGADGWPVKVDTVARRILLADNRGRPLPFDSLWVKPPLGTVSYAKIGTNELLVTGRVGPDSIVARLRRLDEHTFPLLKPSFRWVRG